MRFDVGKRLGAWVAFSERHAMMVITTITLLALAAGLGAWRYAAIDSDLGKLIRPSADLAWYQHDLAFKAAFPQLQQTAVVVVSGADAIAVRNQAQSLVAAFRRHTAFEQVLAPELDPFFDRQRLYYLDPDALEAWIAAVSHNVPVLQQLAARPDLTTLAALATASSTNPPAAARQHPATPEILTRLLQGLWEPDGPRIDLAAYPRLQKASSNNYALITLKGEQRLDQRLPNEALVATIREIVDGFREDAGVGMEKPRIRLTGEIVLADEEIGMALQGIGIAGALSLLMLALILGIGIRSWKVIVALFTLLLTGTLLTLGYATLVVGYFNTLALMFVVMFFGLGVDFAAHFVLRIREARSIGEPGTNNGSLSAAVVAARDVGPALGLCLLTSSIGFLSFVPTAYRGLGELGLISAGGMVVAFVLTLTLIPALFKVLGVESGPPPGRPLVPRPARLHPLAILCGAALLTAAAGWLAKDLKFDYSVLAMRDASTEAMSTLLELQAHHITTDYSTSVLAADTAAARRLKPVLEALPESGAVSIPEDRVPADQAYKRTLIAPLAARITEVQLHPDQAPTPAATQPAPLPFDHTVIDGPTQMRLNQALQEAIVSELAALNTLLTARPFELDDLPADLLSLLITADGRHLVTVEPAAPITSRAATENFIQAVANVAPNFAGRAVVEWGVGNVVVTSFTEAASLAVATIFLLLLIYFRSLLLPVLVLVPIAMAILLTFAIAELSGLTLNMANVLVVPLIFGLGVDTGIHVVHRFTHAGSVAGVFASSTARAVIISGLTTIGTFVSLSFSPHKGAASVGLLLSIAIGLMLAATFILLPALLRLSRRGNQPELD
ncbi:MAG: MMPL family transporter [Pseudomonadales bacterium]